MKQRLFCFLFIVSSFFFSHAIETLPVLRINFPAASLPDDDYISGLMSLEETDGTLIELPAKFQTRGATAKQFSMKPSFNMKLETEEGEELDTDLLGIRKASSWILDAMAIDRICMRNRVAFDIWNQYAKLPYSTDFDSRNGTKGEFLIVYINDQYKGIYCLSDKINRKLLDLKKPKVEEDEVVIRGVLYKQGTNDIANQETEGFYNNYMVYVAAWHDAWELKEPDDYPSLAAWQPLIDYYDNYTSSFIMHNFFTQNLIDYTLLISVLGIQDNWGLKNKYFSVKNSIGDDEQRKFIVTPWDLDTALGGHYIGDYFDGNYSEWTMQQIANTALLPFSVCFTDPSLKTAMKERWTELRETAFSIHNVSSWLNKYCDLFVESGAWQQYTDFWNLQKSRPKYVENLPKEISLIEEWYANRFNMIDEYFGIESGIETISDEISSPPIFNLQGLPVDLRNLKKGDIYIKNGKKFIKK